MSVHDAPATFVPGSEIVQLMPFKYGVFQRAILPRGSFATTSDHYTIVVATTPFQGSLELDGEAPMNGNWSLGEYCSFCPGDRITAVSKLSTVVEALLLNSRLIDTFLNDEVLGTSNALASGWFHRRIPVMVRSIWQRLRIAADEADPVRSRTAALCVELLLVRLLEEQMSSSSQPAIAHMPAIREAIGYIETNLSEPLDLKSIAAVAGLSPFHFSRVFRTSCGTTVHRFVLERRLELASQLLQQGTLSISRIALEAGFSSQSHLTTAFRQRYGATPAAFRQQTGMAGCQ